MKKVRYVLFLLICLLFSKNVYANDIKSINMDIYVDNNGDAHVTETWQANLNKGTEGYKPYYNLGASSIIDYKVAMNGVNFTTLDYWDVDASFTAKKYKAGINSIDNGYELCFGISTYGNNTYTLKYTITNFVSEVEDADMIYWQLIPYELSDKPESVYIKIYSDFKYADTIDVWGYGYGDKKNNGYAYVYNGFIEMTKEGSLDSDEYMVVLAKFPKGTFNTTNKLDEDFNYYLDMAKDGSVSYTDKKVSPIFAVIMVIFAFILNLVPFVILGFLFWFVLKYSSRYGTKNLKFTKGAKKLKDVPYFRDIPCNKDIFAGYWISCQYNLIKRNTDFLGALLLKWLKNGNIQNVTITKGNKEERAVKLVNYDGLSELEQEIYGMMLNASVDGTLESNEFKNWCKNNYKKILNWFNKVIDEQTMKYVASGLITENKKTIGMEYIVSESINESAKQVAGLKKFLQDFSNIKDRESIEVHLWEEYLMFAQIFGIAEQVAKEFKKLYPDVITDEYYNDVIFIHTISFEGVNAASVAKSRAESYSSGGGGFSSSGGGGSSFGGGGGGGGFR